MRGCGFLLWLGFLFAGESGRNFIFIRGVTILVHLYILLLNTIVETAAPTVLRRSRRSGFSRE